MLTTSNRPLALSIAVHVLLVIVLLLGVYFERPHLLTQAAAADAKPVIKAAIVDNKTVAKAIARQEQAEKKKQLQLAEQKQQAEKLKQEVKKAKELAEKLKAEAETARVLAKEELAKASKIQQQVAEAKQQAEKLKQQAEKDKKVAEQAKEQAAAAKQQQAKAEAEKQQAAKAETARIAELQAKSQAADEQLRAEKRRRWLDSEFDRFVASMTERVYNNRTLSSTFQENLVCKIQIQLMPDGSVSMVKVVGSSGNPAYDSMAEAAVYKSAPFDMPADNELVSRLRDIIFEFKDEDYMS